MTASIPRHQVQEALQVLAGQARDARDAYHRELAACRKRGLIRPYSVPASLTERTAHWNMARLMLHAAVTHLLFSGRNTARVDRYVSDLIGGERWPTEDARPVGSAHAADCGLQGSGLNKHCTCGAPPDDTRAPAGGDHHA